MALGAVSVAQPEFRLSAARLTSPCPAPQIECRSDIRVF